MTKTFFALLKLADLSTLSSSKPIKQEKTGETLPPKEKPIEKEIPKINPPGLHYNIQIHLAATKDIEVYNAIFKSLKEHLIG